MPTVVISPTHWLMRFHEQHGWFTQSHKEVLPLPVANPSEVSGEGVSDVPRDPKQLLFLSRVDASKGADLLVDAWPQLRDVASRLIFVSAGDLCQVIADQHLPGVEVRGQLEPDEVLRVMRQSGVLVVPSRVLENQPMVIIEGLTAGCQIVATDVGGVRETLDSAGWVVPPNSVPDIVVAIREALTSHSDAAREAARQRVLQSHDLEQVGGRMLEVLMGRTREH